MSEYQKPYLILWGAITRALEEMKRQNYGRAYDILLNAQRDAEEAYLSWQENEENRI